MNEPFRRQLTSILRKGGERTKAKLAGQIVRIWSGERRAWWRPDCAGYTVHIEAAGIYTFEDAFAASGHCGPEKRISYVLVDMAPAEIGTVLSLARAAA